MAGRAGTALTVGLLVAAGAAGAALLTHQHGVAETARLERRIQQLESELRRATERVAQLERRPAPRCPERSAADRPGRPGGGAGASTPTVTRASDLEGVDPPVASSRPDAADDAAPEWDRRWLDAWQRDADRYGAAAMEQIEQLYRAGGDDFDTVEGREKLAELVEQYPESNRAQCAAMNLGGAYLEEGDLAEAQAWLELVIDSESGAVFGNGEPVLPKALLNYGMLWQEQGDESKARAAWQRVVDELGDEADANGSLYGVLAAELLGTLSP